MRFRPMFFAVAILALTRLVFTPAATAQEADAIKTQAKKLLEVNQDAVVHVKITTKQRMSFFGQEGQGQDTQTEVTGTIIDPSGLAVVSDSDIDPMSMMMSMMGGLMGGAGLEGGFEAQSDVTDVKIVLKDGKEVPARLVLRDKDLDLAFVAPQQKDMKLAHVTLGSGKAPEFFDEVFVLRRLGRTLDRQPAIGLARISAIVQKPRTFYVPDSMAEQLGCPVLDRQGKAIGITVRRRGPVAAGGMFNFAGLAGAMTAVILPADDVKEVAEQALAEAAKPPQKKAEEKKGDDSGATKK